MRKIIKTPMIVIETVFSDEFLLCASGKISDIPMYNKNPAKNPIYNNNVFSDNTKNKVDKPPRAGATASINKNRNACLFVFL